MSITTLPTPPSTASPSNFDSRADAFLGALPTFVTEANALATDVNAKQVLAAQSVTDAAAQVTLATAQAVASANSAAASSATANVTKWISGTTYNEGVTTWSPSTYLTYRRKSTGGGTTDPSADTTNWSLLTLPAQGLGGSSATGNLTLTSGSDAAMVVTPTGYGLYATLPNATTMAEGIAAYSIYNAGEYDYGIKNNSGTILGWISPLKSVVISLVDNSTAAGVWGTEGIQKIAETARYENNTATAGASVATRITVDSTREIFLYGTTNCYAVVYDSSDNTFGSTYTVRTSVGSGFYVGILAGTDKVLVVSCDSTTGVEAVTLSLSGKVVTVNSGTKATKTIAGNMNALGNITAVGSSWVVGWRRASSVAEIVGISISSTTPTLGTESSLDITSNSNPPLLLVTGSNLRAVCINATQVSCKPYTISGATLTAGTSATDTTTSSNLFRAFVNGNSNVVVTYINSTTYCTIFKLTGTVEAASSVSLTNAPSTVSGVYVSQNNISASKMLVSTVVTTDVEFNILTDTAGTASAGTKITYSNMGSGSCVHPAISYGNNMSVIRVEGGVARYFVIDCSGTSPVLSSLRNLTYDSSTITHLASGQDKYATISASVLRSTTRDVITASGKVGVMAVSLNKDYFWGYVGRISSVAGRSTSIGWNSPSVGTLGIVLTKIEVAE